jgi:ABC-type transporter Mla subunit MlaD
MADEESDGKMEFIIDQQAQFAANLGRLEEIVVRLADATLRRFEAVDDKLSEVDQKLAALVDSQIRTEESVRVTSENLKNLTAVVDQYFRSRNGKSEG